MVLGADPRLGGSGRLAFASRVFGDSITYKSRCEAPFRLHVCNGAAFTFRLTG